MTAPASRLLLDESGCDIESRVTAAVHGHHGGGRRAVGDDAKRAVGRGGRAARGRHLHRHPVALVLTHGVPGGDQDGLGFEFLVGAVRGAAGVARRALRSAVAPGWV